MRFLRWRFLESGLSKIFTVSKFRKYFSYKNHPFFSKCLKLGVDSRNGSKNWEKLFRFWDNCIWIENCKFSQSWTGYWQSVVHVLTNTSKISPKTSEDTFGINFPQNDEKQDKSGLIEISQVFRMLSFVDWQCAFWDGAI